jgi:hypothetical protein
MTTSITTIMSMAMAALVATTIITIIMPMKSLLPGV